MSATKQRPPIRSNHRYVDDLRPGDIVTGTGPSGAYEHGSHRVLWLEVNPQESVRTTAYWLHFTDGLSLCYYGDTVVEVADAHV